MTLEELEKYWEEYSDSEYYAFDRVENKLCSARDLHAFLLIDKLIPSTFYVIDAAEHDIVYLGVSVAALAEVITPEQIKELVRCGICYDDTVTSLCYYP